MTIGPRHWGCVTTDSAGAPHGGPFGDVRRAERALGRYGLTVGWSRRGKCFLVCSHRGAKWVCQMRLRNGRGPIPFSDNLVWLLRYAWTEHCRKSPETIIEHIAQLERDRERDEMKARYEETALVIKDAVQETWYAMGRETRPLISVPRRASG